VTTIGDPSDHEVYIRLGTAAATGVEEADLTGRVTAALRAEGRQGAGQIDLNLADRATIAAVLRDLPELESEQIDALTEAITERRRDRAILSGFSDVSDLPEMTPAALQRLQETTHVGPLAIRSQSYIGPTIGRELMQKAVLAIAGSLVGMLIYIGIRFEFQWGFAAVAALAHDTLLTLGLFALFQKELSLPVVAAFLTLVGYSVNDTVVIFDRVRENQRLHGTGLELSRLINLSINQTLSRSLITSGLTWVAVLGLYLFGGQALNPFAFVLVIGVIVGSYSTIYIAAPILMLLHGLVARRRARTAGASA
jgi:preprotein translocase subunit SecF